MRDFDCGCKLFTFFYGHKKTATENNGRLALPFLLALMLSSFVLALAMLFIVHFASLIFSY